MGQVWVLCGSCVVRDEKVRCVFVQPFPPWPLPIAPRLGGVSAVEVVDYRLWEPVEFNHVVVPVEPIVIGVAGKYHYLHARRRLC